MTKLIKEVKKVNGTTWKRTIGVDTNLLDLIEELEIDSRVFYTEEGYWGMPPTTEYVVTLNGKEVDPKDIKIQLYDSPEYLQEYFTDTNDEYNERHFTELYTDEELLAMSKKELLALLRK